MQRCAYLCSEVNGEGNDPEVDGPKRQEARVQEEGHGLLLSEPVYEEPGHSLYAPLYRFCSGPSYLRLQLVRKVALEPG
ncbi:unnamed protein product [Boreogadus saida]